MTLTQIHNKQLNNYIEIRIEKILSKSDGEIFYFVYAYLDNRISLIGKSKTKPNILRYQCTYL